jgi:hypothetical protein
MTHDAVACYHDLLTDDRAVEAQGLLDAAQRRLGLTFGGRPLCTVLRPRFLSVEQDQLLRTRVPLLLGAFAKAHAAALSDPATLRQFHLTEAEQRLLAIEPGYRSPMPTARLDAFFVGPTDLRCTEFNAETPAGAAYGDELAAAFLGLPVMAAFARRYRIVAPSAKPGVLHALLGAFEEWSGTRNAPPRIAILDWSEVPTYSEFLLFERYFRDRGFECVIADPRTVEYRDGRLMAGDFAINLIYKRVLISELIERLGLDCAVVRAVRDGAVCMVNPFRCKPLYKKASLAVLSDERNAALFSAAERHAVAEHIPWTRVVEERKTECGGRPVDLVPFVLANRDRLVLKPNDDYGGKGIVLGWTVDASRWDEAVRHALTTPFVVQERLTLPSEPFPALVDGRLHVSERLLDVAPFVVQAEYVDGCLTRIATDPLLNVTAGGGSTVPTFVVEGR